VITDGGWSQLAYRGLKELRELHGFKTAYAETSALRRWTRSRGDTPMSGSIWSSATATNSAAPCSKSRPDYPSQHYFVTTFLLKGGVPGNIMYVNMGYFGAAMAQASWPHLSRERKTSRRFHRSDDEPESAADEKSLYRWSAEDSFRNAGARIITGDYDNAAKAERLLRS